MALSLSLRKRITLAVISALGVVLVRLFEPDLDSSIGSIIFYGLSGLFFAAGVLFPYIRQDKFMHLRAVGLTIASAFSYRCAYWVAVESPLVNLKNMFPLPLSNWLPFTAASITGAAIVVAALIAMAPIRSSVRLLVAGLFAGIIGGFTTMESLPAEGFPALALGYASWHVLICLAIYYGTRLRVDVATDVEFN